MYKHILIATDGSTIAHKGVEHGLGLAKALNAKATVVFVSRPFPLGGMEFTGWVAGENDLLRYEASVKEFAERVFGEAKAIAGRIGVTPAYVEVTSDSAAQGILDTAKKEGCDVIAMASHGRRGVGRLLLGSETAEVVHSAHIPVLVIR
jgi:nucleotide-binding universal stress UspA family protein